MNKIALYNYIRSKYPKAFGIRRKLQRIKIQRLKSRLLNKDIVYSCENKQLNISELVSDRNNRKTINSISFEMEDMISNCKDCGLAPDDIRDDISFCRLAYGFLPSEYYGFELYNKSAKQRKAYMSDIDTYVFGYMVNDISFMQKVIDKGQSVDLFGYLYKRDYIVIEKKSDYSKFASFIKTHPTFVMKYTNSCMGKNIDKVDINRLPNSVYEFFLSAIAKGKWLIEELVVQSSKLSVFNSSSVNTIRVITFRTNKGIIVPWCFMRVGRKGSFVDNGGAGGILIGIDPLTGILNTDGYDEHNYKYDKHPDSKVIFRGYQIPEWDTMLNICKRAAEKEPLMGYLSWDMAYTDEGWKVIEVNGIGQLIGPQIVYKKGIKRDIINYLQIMDKMV